MIIAYNPQSQILVRPDEWIQRRFRLPPATAQLVCELAFSNRIATLADRGISTVPDLHCVGARA